MGGNTELKLPGARDQQVGRDEGARAMFVNAAGVEAVGHFIEAFGHWGLQA